MRVQAHHLSRHIVARYLVALGAVVTALALRVLLAPLTGFGAPFVLFFAAVLVTSLYAGTGPGLAALVVSVPLGAYLFVVRAGYPVDQAIFQALLYAVDGLIVVYITHLTTRRRHTLDQANAELQRLRLEAERSAAHTRDVLELAPDAFFQANLDARYTDVNRAACRLLGYDRNELLGMTILDLIPAEDAARLEADRQEMLLPGATRRNEWTLKRKDGTLVPVEVSANILEDGRWQAFVRDISDARRSADERERLLAAEQAARRQLETAIAQLRESEARFRLTIDEAPIGMALVALDGTFARVNRVLCELTGYSAEELTKLKYQDITHPDDLATDVTLSQQLARGEIPRYHLEKRYIRKDGSVVDVMLSGSILRGANNAPLCYIAQIEDITDRKRAERELRRSEAKFSGIVSIAADAIISVDSNQRITVFNEGAEQIFGYSKQEMIGTYLERLLPERHRMTHRASFTAFQGGGAVARAMADRMEVHGLRKSGEEFPAEASISKVIVGSDTFFSVVLRDISYRKSVEQALERAVAARDVVLGIVAHDLRNPLSLITLTTRAMQRRPDDGPDRRHGEATEAILRAARRMNQLIEDLLDVALIEAGRLRVECELLPAVDLAHDAVEMQRVLAEASGMTISLEVEPDVRTAWGDRRRLLQVFENLIGNAIKFTQPGGRIVVRAAVTDADVLFSVTDTGAGIAPDALPHVFDRFWQATARTRRLGAGLGLPITKGIVEAHGGRIWVESDVTRGTTFFFTIPASPRSAPYAHRERAPGNVAAKGARLYE
jgi:PAS domain S-box-containing protein